ncbi:hypothetical protein NZD89_13895 [Alicyclobacillus fastidiosus]|uniref:Uncharacterized protein n=1 Tax=Alicyclobacillus fastidiosus TaxID=392011 RepID=A0ABY6ZNH0_9BACL|nr:hypothetical protein [Alicyclobacillus fastidiosus]WAH44380.1 hypothetical protein NZD89_13895 [Alicyclobacillus fastidiosus]GMA60715.1 hypothetical protein GCM10025859_11550 [Alicyclobacillus fastidiosus]
MGQETWQWVLQSMPDEELAAFAKLTKAQVQGFRTITSANIKNIRPLVVNDILTKINKVKSPPTRVDRDSEDIRQRSLADLQEDVANGADVVDILLALLTSKESTHHTTADLLFDKLKSNGELDRIAEKMAELKTQEQLEREQKQNQEELVNNVKDLERKLKASQEKVDQLKEQIEELKQTHFEERKKWKQERDDFIKQSQLLKDKATALESSSTSNNLVQAEWEKERSKLQAEIERQNTEITHLRNLSNKVGSTHLSGTTMADAFAKVDLFQVIQGTPPTSEEKSSDGPSKEIKPRKLPSVCLIGSRTKANQDARATLKYQVQIVEANDIDHIISNQDTWSGFDQVWMLTYETTMRSQRKIQRVVDPERLKVFHNHNELVQYMNR